MLIIFSIFFWSFFQFFSIFSIFFRFFFGALSCRVYSPLRVSFNTFGFSDRPDHFLIPNVHSLTVIIWFMLSVSLCSKVAFFERLPLYFHFQMSSFRIKCSSFYFILSSKIFVKNRLIVYFQQLRYYFILLYVIYDHDF